MLICEPRRSTTTCMVGWGFARGNAAARVTLAGMQTALVLGLEQLVGDDDDEPVHWLIPGTRLSWCGQWLTRGAVLMPEEEVTPASECRACCIAEAAALARS